MHHYALRGITLQKREDVDAPDRVHAMAMDVLGPQRKLYHLLSNVIAGKGILPKVMVQRNLFYVMLPEKVQGYTRSGCPYPPLGSFTDIVYVQLHHTPPFSLS
jgi:hypothetical protein